MTQVIITFKEQPNGMTAMLVAKSKSDDCTDSEMLQAINMKIRIKGMLGQLSRPGTEGTLYEGSHDVLAPILKATGLDGVVKKRPDSPEPT